MNDSIQQSSNMWTEIKRELIKAADEFFNSELCSHLLDSVNLGFMAVIGYFHLFENGINLELLVQKIVFVVLSIFSLVRGYNSMMMTISSRRIQEEALSYVDNAEPQKKPMWIYYILSILVAMIAAVIIYLIFKA